MKVLSVGKSLTFSFNIIKKNPVAILIPTLGIIIIRLLYHIIYQQFYHFPGSNIANIFRTEKTVPLNDLILFEIILPFFFIALTAIFLIIFYKIGIQVYEKKKVALKTIRLPNFSFLVRYLLLVIVFTALQFVGFLLLLIPGFIFSFTYLWVFIIFFEDHKLSFKELFRKSASLSKGIRWPICGYFFLIFIALQGLNFFLQFLFDTFFQSGSFFMNQGVILIILTLIFTPTVALSYSYLYKDLDEQKAKMI